MTKAVKDVTKVFVVFGTRPEAIKMAPVVLALRRQSTVAPVVCVTGQHRAMLDEALAVFGITPDIDLNVMSPDQTPSAVTAAILHRLDPLLAAEKPELMLVHGDTTTSFAAALSAFYRSVPVGHVEAGLRTGNLMSPWPEEFNRRMVDLIAKFLWAPTEEAAKSLRAEGVPEERISVTGNTVVDALALVRERIMMDRQLRLSLEARVPEVDTNKRLILVTGHRRESFAGGIAEVCRALGELAKRPDVQILWPVHPNPTVRDAVARYLSDSPNIFVTEPLDYMAFVAQMMRAHLILTDSGGIQEEAPSLGKPVLVTRNETERPEAIEQGTARLVGSSSARISKEVSLLLDDPAAYSAMVARSNPFGDGQASERIALAVAGSSFKAG